MKFFFLISAACRYIVSFFVNQFSQKYNFLLIDKLDNKTKNFIIEPKFINLDDMIISTYKWLKKE